VSRSFYAFYTSAGNELLGASEKLGKSGLIVAHGIRDFAQL
jgi:hypothetical protein